MPASVQRARSVEARILLPAPATRARAASEIVARDAVPHASFLGELRSGELLVVETPGLAEPPGRLLRRSGTTFAVEAELRGVNAPATLSPSGRTLLAAGPLRGGMQASCVLVDLEAWRITRTLPLVRPFVWLDDTHFVAQTPGWKSRFESGRTVRLDERNVAPEIVAGAPGFLGTSHGMVVVDLDAGSVRPLLSSLLLDEETSAVLSPSRELLYTATPYSRISCVRLSDGALLWQRQPVGLVTEGTTYALGFDALRGLLIAVGLGAHDMLLLDAASGEQVGVEALCPRLARAGLPASLRLQCLAIRADGLIAIGTEKGVLVERWPDGRWEAHKVAGRALEAVAFVRGGAALLVGGAEKNLRLVPCDP